MRLGKKKRTLCISFALVALALVLEAASRLVDGFAGWYSTCLYPAWVGSIGRLMGYLPFSVSELLLCLLVVAAVAFIGRGVRAAVYKRAESGGEQDKGQGPYLWPGYIVLFAAVLVFLYVVNCGINYQRESFSESSGIRAEEYSAEQLTQVCRWLTGQVADYSDRVKRGADGGMVLDISVQEQAVEAMNRLGRKYPELEGYYPRPKKLVNSWILSVQSLSGVYSPFTIEANFNGDMQDFYIPYTACHELSHLRGFMQEQEANFIAFLACSGSGEDAFAYSGYLSAWIQCMNVLHKADYDAWEELRGQFPAAAEADLKLNREFWARYDGRIAQVSNRVNDTYLKANGQKDGVKSYNRMVDLIVAYYMQGISGSSGR